MAAASHTQMQQQGVAVLAAVLVPVLVQARFRNDFFFKGLGDFSFNAVIVSNAYSA